MGTPPGSAYCDHYRVSSLHGTGSRRGVCGISGNGLDAGRRVAAAGENSDLMAGFVGGGSQCCSGAL